MRTNGRLKETFGKGLLAILLLGVMTAPLVGPVSTDGGDLNARGVGHKAVAKQSQTIGLSQAPRFYQNATPTATSEVTSYGNCDWDNNTDEVKTEDGSCATSTTPSSGTYYTHILKTCGYGFNIPPTATIRGIKVEFRCITNLFPRAQVAVSQLYKVSGLVGENKSYYYLAPTMEWLRYGYETDLWNASWTPSDINNNGFGHALALKLNASSTMITASVDAVIITVYYDIGTTPGYPLVEWNCTTDGPILITPVICDIDNDGHLETVVLSESSLNCLRWDSGVGVQRNWSWTVPGAVWTALSVGNLDEDAKLEEIVGDSQGHIICRTANVATRWNYNATDWINSLVTADIDNDTRSEVLASSLDGNLYCLNSTGGLKWKYPTGGGIWASPTVADVDNDHRLEVLVTSLSVAPYFSGVLYCLSYEGACEWNWTTGSPIYCPPLVGDFEGDGRQEILVGSGNLITCLNWDNSAGLRILWTQYLYYTTSFAVGDLDGDSTLEFVRGHMDGGVYCYNWSLLFKWAWSFGVPITNNSLAIYDVDGDAQQEILVEPLDRTLYCIDRWGQLEWNCTVGSMILTPPAMGDIDGDNQIEIAVGSGDKNVYFLSAPNIQLLPPSSGTGGGGNGGGGGGGGGGSSNFGIYLVPIAAVGLVSLVVVLAIVRSGRSSEDYLERESAYRQGEVPGAEAGTEGKPGYIPAIPAVACARCGASLKATDEYCWNCGTSTKHGAAASAEPAPKMSDHKPSGICMVCKSRLARSDEVLSCPYCGSLAHRDHFLEWLHVKDFCPTCGRHLDERDVSS